MMTRILHITLLLSVLFSSTSWVLNKHYCSDELVNTALMTVPESCHTDDTKEECPDHAQSRDDCCTNEAELIKTELNYDLIGTAIIPALCVIRTFFFGVIRMTGFRHGHQSGVDKLITAIMLIEHPAGGAK